MTLRFNNLLIGFIGLCFSACHGRSEDPVTNTLPFERQTYGLSASKPLILGFSALWCKPCVKEVSTLNLAHAQFGDRVSILVFLVEGSQRSAVSEKQDETFLEGPGGERPAFDVKIDPKWDLYRKIALSEEKKLPFLVFADSNDRIVFKHFGSLPFEGGLVPMVEKLISGEANPGLQDEPGPLVNEALSIKQWIRGASLTPESAKYQWLLAVMNDGAKAEGFAGAAFDFESGNITFSAGPASFISQAQWMSVDSGCRLSVGLDAAGKIISTEGFCGV